MADDAPRPGPDAGRARLSGDVAVEHLHGPAEALHARVPDPASGPALWVCHVASPTLVLGSTQPDDVVDVAVADAAGVGVARRRSGGGAVLLWPGEHLWVDVVLPAGDRRWEADVSRASMAAGEWWVAALAATATEAHDGGWTVHRGGADREGPGRLLCMAGRGPGEVLAGGRKLVGISQRRTRAWCRIQCVVHRSLRLELCAELLTGPAAGASLDVDALGGTITTLAAPPLGPGDDAVVARLLAALTD